MLLVLSQDKILHLEMRKESFPPTEKLRLKNTYYMRELTEKSSLLEKEEKNTNSNSNFAREILLITLEMITSEMITSTSA